MIDVDDEDLSEEIREACACKIQSTIRRFLSRCRLYHLVVGRFEKIFDPKRKRFYYYDKVMDRSSWKKPSVLRKTEILEISPTYTQDEAAMLIQRNLLRRAALRKVRVLYKKTVQVVVDEASKRKSYLNPLTGSHSHKLPNFMGGRLDHGYEKLDKKARARARALRRKSVHDLESETESEEGSVQSSESELSESSEAIIERRREGRKYPRFIILPAILCLFYSSRRSKCQLIVDEIEDEKRITELNLSGIGAKRFTSRIYDFAHLISLNLSNNKLRRISPNIQYMQK